MPSEGGMIRAYRPDIRATPRPSHLLSILHRSSFVALVDLGKAALCKGSIEDGGSQKGCSPERSRGFVLGQNR